MCGRYTLFTDKELREIDEIIDQVSHDAEFYKMKTGEIFPTDLVPVLVPDKKRTAARLFSWGFPNFRNKGVIINARSETLHEKPMFRSSLEARRCVIPSTGFYEWNSAKKKFIFNMPDSNVLYMAGLYNQFDGENRFVIITTNANNSVSDIHNRMPLVLPKESLEDWLLDNHAADELLVRDHPSLIKNPA